MTTHERIGLAQATDDLGEVATDEIGDVDIIRSCGMAGLHNPLGLSIWRWRVGGDSREIFAVARGLIELGHDAHLVRHVLAHLANDVCKHCQGRGYEQIPGAPVLSDEICVHCSGTGRAPLVGEKEKELGDIIAQLERQFAQAVMAKLARQLDF